PPSEQELNDIFSKLGPGQESGPPPDMLHSLGKSMYDILSHAVKSASPFQTGPILDTAQAAAAPAAGGLLRMPPNPNASIGEQTARVIGQGLPVAAGTALAGAALPVVAPAAAAASPLLA